MQHNYWNTMYYYYLQTFAGNTDTDTEVQHMMDPIIKTTHLTLEIISCEGTCSLRMEILGCIHGAGNIV